MVKTLCKKQKCFEGMVHGSVIVTVWLSDVNNFFSYPTS